MNQSDDGVRALQGCATAPVHGQSANGRWRGRLSPEQPHGYRLGSRHNTHPGKFLHPAGGGGAPFGLGGPPPRRARTSWEASGYRRESRENDYRIASQRPTRCSRYPRDLDRQRRSAPGRCLWGRHPAGRNRRVQPTDPLRPCQKGPGRRRSRARVGPTHAELIQENQHLRQENARLWDWLAETVEFPPSKQQEFTVTAAAMGLSLSQMITLLALILGTQVRPGRGTLGRWVQAAGIAAGRVLKHLDRQCRPLVLVDCLDEIFFHGRPVLVGVEPASMTWFLGHKADDRTGPPGVSTADMDLPGIRVGRRGYGLQAGHRVGPAAAQRRRTPRWRTAWMSSIRCRKASGP